MSLRVVLISLILCMLTISCIERQPNVANQAPLNTNRTTPASTAASTVNPNAPFVYVQNPIKGFMQNLGISEAQALQIQDLRAASVSDMAPFKMPNGKYDLDKCAPVIEAMQSKIRGVVGPSVFPRYVKYNAWFAKERVSRANR